MTGLVGWWPLTESAGDARDLSGEGNHGTVNGAVQAAGYAPGGVRAYSFDGVDDTVNVGPAVDPRGDDFTVGAWVKGTSTGNANIYGTSATSPRFFLKINNSGDEDTGRAFFDSGGGGVDVVGSTVVIDGTWHHLALKREGSEFSLYTDGQLDASTVDTGEGDVSNGSDEELGVVLDGEISGVRAYSRALSAAEIQTLYEWGSGDYAQPPTDADGGVSWYSFDDDATDQWGTNDGTVNGATFVSDGGPRGEGAYSFDGVDDYIHINSTIVSTYDYTVTGWVKTTNAGDSYMLVISESGEPSDIYSVGLRSGNAGMTSYEGAVGFEETTGTFIADGYWHFIAAVYTGPERRLYTDGVLDATDDNSAQSFVNTDQADIGRAGDSTPGAYVDGEISDVRVYDRALSPAEIAQLYRYGTLGRDMRKLAVEAR